MLEIIEMHKKHKHNRKNYYIKWTVEFARDHGHSYQVFSFLPNIIWVPWYWRNEGHVIFDVTWLNFHILIGEFRRKKDEND